MDNAEYEKAERILISLLEEYPDQWELLFLLGKVLTSLKKYEDSSKNLLWSYNILYKK